MIWRDEEPNKTHNKARQKQPNLSPYYRLEAPLPPDAGGHYCLHHHPLLGRPSYKVMEVVVSPLTFGQGQGGSKRRFGSSPIHSSSNPATVSTEDFDMDDDCNPGGDGYGFQSTKRRRRGSGEGLGTESSSCSFQAKENWSPSPFAMAPCRSPMAAAAGKFNY